MRTSIFARTMGLTLAGLVAAAAAGCDEGTSNTTDGGSGGGMSTAGSSAGGTSTGGQGTGGQGTGGAPANTSMIDDMEDGDGSILAADGRKGAWYTYNDETATATQEPAVGVPFPMTAIDPPRAGSAFAARTNGNGFMTWGSGFGFDLNNAGAGSVKGAYDASKYAGITFWAKVGAGTSPGVRVNIGDKNTTPEGGVCAADKCSDDFGKDINLTEDWQQITINFSDMAQVGWSMVLLPEIDKSALYAVHFQTGANKMFDIWIDDVAFFE